MGGTMQLPYEIFGEIAVLHAPEELTEENAPTLFSTLEQIPVTHIVLDLERTELIDSAGLTAIVNIHELLEQRQGSLRLVASHPINRKILHITGIEQTIPVYDTVVEAAKTFHGGL